MIYVRLEAYVFEIFSKCKVLVSAIVVLFVCYIVCLFSIKDFAQQPSFTSCNEILYFRV